MQTFHDKVSRAVCRFLEKGVQGTWYRHFKRNCGLNRVLLCDNPPPPYPLWFSVPRGGTSISGYRECIDKVSPSLATRENVLGILCEKSRFYAKNHIFFNLGCVPCAPPLESATGSSSDNNST